METDKQVNAFFQPISTYLDYRYNDLIEIPKLENVPIEVVDEWDTPGICTQIEKQNPCMIKATFAGSGKSCMGQCVKKVHKQFLYVVPHNRLSQEIEGDTTTSNIFLKNSSS